MKSPHDSGSPEEQLPEDNDSDQSSVDGTVFESDSASDNDASRMAEGMRWISVITTVVIEMFLPAVAGSWIDGKLGTNFLSLLGLVLGVSVGIYHLILMTKQNEGQKKKIGKPNKKIKSLTDEDQLRKL